jgi:NAD(P)H-flavin reductase
MRDGKQYIYSVKSRFSYVYIGQFQAVWYFFSMAEKNMTICLKNTQDNFLILKDKSLLTLSSFLN